VGLGFLPIDAGEGLHHIGVEAAAVAFELLREDGDGLGVADGAQRLDRPGPDLAVRLLAPAETGMGEERLETGAGRRVGEAAKGQHCEVGVMEVPLEVEGQGDELANAVVAGALRESVDGLVEIDPPAPTMLLHDLEERGLDRLGTRAREPVDDGLPPPGREVVPREGQQGLDPGCMAGLPSQVAEDEEAFLEHPVRNGQRQDRHELRQECGIGELLRLAMGLEPRAARAGAHGEERL